MYSPSLKDVAWLEDTQLIFLIFHTFVRNLFPENRAHPAKFRDKIHMENLKIHCASSSQAR